MTDLVLAPENRQATYGQYMTPEWAASLLVERFFGDLTSSDLVIEPSCGTGSFLKAIPDSVPTIGVELDPALAAVAERNSGRPVIVGDFANVSLPEGVTAICGNPPFAVKTINSFLARAANILPHAGRCGMLLPAYVMQTHNTVWKWRERFSMQAEIVPRRLFPRLRLPLLFVMFTRNSDRKMIGFALYHEAVEFDRLGDTAKEKLTNGTARKGVWRALLEELMAQLGGEATLEEIYRAAEPKRPTPNAHWKDKLRQELQLRCVPVERGRWKNPAAPPPVSAPALQLFA